MRWAMLLLSTVVLAGCAGRAPTRSSAPPGLAYADRPAMALVFVPPVAIDQEPLLLDRDIRQPAAFWGFDQFNDTAFYIRTEDRQDDWGYDHYLRRAVIERFGTASH